jgi:hypothetical protein
MSYENSLNHQQWLETVPDSSLPFVPATVTAWDTVADRYNKWSDLGWDERDELLRAHSDSPAPDCRLITLVGEGRRDLDG